MCTDRAFDSFANHPMVKENAPVKHSKIHNYISASHIIS